ncbi:MAG: MBOAT family protein [Fimbriimonadaceae bacterium]
MLFNSLAFVVFLPAALGVLFVMPARWQRPWLLAASLVFYSWGGLRDVPLLLGVVAWTYLCAARCRGPKGHAWMVAGVAGPLALLALYKYGGFVLANLKATGLEVSIATGLALPVGISFFTFKALSFVVGVRRGTVEAVPTLGRYALFVCFFPPLVAGPIMRPEALIPQLGKEFRFDPTNFVMGLRWMLWGFFKKLAVADVVAPFVDRAYAPGASPPGPVVAAATVLFALQIYCDFSGYTDIAVGAARMLGIELTRNFDRPYFARSLGEFWRRWHISLSTWFRDYVYIPLGGSKHGRHRTALNLLVTFGLSGLWHGAGWNFLFWGLWHGAWVALEHLWSPGSRVRTAFLAVCVLPVVLAGWVLFRADGLGHAAQMIGALGWGWSGDIAGHSIVDALPGIVAGTAVLALQARGNDDGPDGSLGRFPRAVRYSAYAILTIWWAVFGAEGGDAFLYFQF